MEFIKGFSGAVAIQNSLRDQNLKERRFNLEEDKYQLFKTEKQKIENSRLEKEEFQTNLFKQASQGVPEAQNYLAFQKDSNQAQAFQLKKQEANDKYISKLSGIYQKGKLEERKASYSPLLKMAQEKGIGLDLPKEWNKEVDQQLLSYGSMQSIDPETVKNNLNQRKQNLEERKYQNEQINGKASDYKIIKTTEGTYRVNNKTGKSQLLTNSKGEALMPTSDGTTINNTGRIQESEQQKQLGKVYAKKYEQTIDAADQAMRGVNTLETLRQAVSNPNTSQGSFGNIRAESKKIADLFGVDVEGLEDDAIINSVGNKLALQLRSPKGEDGGLTGSTSDRDLKFLIAGVPNRNKTQSQNLALIEIGLRDKKRTIELGNLAYEYIEENNTFRGFNKIKKEFYEKNPLFSNGEDKNKIKNMLKGEKSLENKTENKTKKRWKFNPQTGELE